MTFTAYHSASTAIHVKSGTRKVPSEFTRKLQRSGSSFTWSRQDPTGSPQGSHRVLCWVSVINRGGITQNVFQYAILCKVLKIKFQDYFLDVLMKCGRKKFLVSPQSWSPKQCCHHSFARDENSQSTTYVLDSTLNREAFCNFL